PNRIDLLNRRAGNYLGLREHDRALADIRQAERIDAMRGATFRAILARFLTERASKSQRKDPAGALLDLRKAVEIDPDSPVAHNNLAWLLLTGPEKFRQVKDALVHARRAVELSGTNEPHLNTLGVALYRNDQ